MSSYINRILVAALIAASFGLAHSLPAFAAYDDTHSNITEPKNLSLSFLAGSLYPYSTALGWAWQGLDFRLGWMPLNWGPSPHENLFLSPTRGHLMLYMHGDFAGMELIPPFHWEQAHICTRTSWRRTAHVACPPIRG